jgi:L-threonylcarbamoyladenylate synthase
LHDEFPGYAATEQLSPSGDLRQAAARFFEALHALDAVGVERIDAQPLPETGLGLAMMDRLRRAAASG